MDAYEKFKTSQQAQVRLEIALTQWFHPENEHRTEYEAYLHQRARSAAQYLIEQDDAEKLNVLWDKGWFSGGDLEMFLQLAAKNRKTECLMALMDKKQKAGGFGKPDLSL